MTASSRQRDLNLGRPVTAAAFAAAMARVPLPPGARAAVAVSGGADSMALALLARDWACGMGVSLTGLIVDHCLRAESTDDAVRVGRWLSQLGLAHAVLTWTGGTAVRHLNRSAQDAARTARYALLTDWCRANGADVLLLAHHADDQVETFFLRLARGSGVQGLAGMAALSRIGGILLARPLLDVAKADLIATCRAAGQEWIADPSNADPRYARSRLRRARAVLEAEGLTRERVLATVAHLQRARAALTEAVRTLSHDACIWSETGVATLALGKLLSAPEDVALRLLSDLLKVASGQDYGPRFDGLARLFARLKRGEQGAMTLHGCCILASGDSLGIIREPAAIGGEVALVPGGTVMWDGRFAITCAAGAPTWRVRASHSTDAAWWHQQGFAAPFADVPARVRRGLPVIVDDAGPLAMPQLGLWRADVSRLAHAVTVRFVGRDRIAAAWPDEIAEL